ncbi:MAG: CPBP family glutamic-type intramembrane protease [Terriglobia bacterium]
MTARLTRRQYLIIAIAAAVAAASLLIALRYFSRAFPEATLQLRVDRSGSARIAQRFLTSRGFRLAGYRHAAIFNYDDTTKLYLERTQGLNRMDKLTSGPVHLWRWSHRWFRPQQQEEFRVDVTAAGEVAAFSHEIPEAAAGANLSQNRARQLAESFLTGVMKRRLDTLGFVEAERVKRPARTDYTFIWKDQAVRLGQGSLRVEVNLAGNQVSGYDEFVKIPEGWQRGYARIRSHNNAAQEVDQVFWVLLTIAMLIILVRRLKDGDVPLKLSLALGGAAAGLEFLSRLNDLQVALFSYDTTTSFTDFYAGYVLQGLLVALAAGGFIFLIVASAEPVYRESLPRLISFRRYFTWSGLRTRSFFMASIVGIALAFFFFAYQTVFYLIANHLGAWAPSDIPFSNQLNTTFPWLAVLFTGFFPAISEEMQFRAFAIPFLKKATRSWPLALVLAAFNWGFLHSAYPNQPFFIRGVEVGVGGIIIGVIMLRFGIIATIMWHYSVDALYEAFLLLRSSNHYLMFSGGLCAGIMLIPLFVALAAYLRTGTFAEEGPVTNAAEGLSRAPGAEATPEPGAPVLYRRFSRRKLWAALVVVLICAACASLKIERLGGGIKLRITRAEAAGIAAGYLGGKHVNPAGDLSAAWPDRNVDDQAVRYFLQRLPVRQVNRIVRETSDPYLWQVRFFRPLDPEEYRVFISAASGKVYSFEHVLPETAPGATLTPAQARSLGERAVTQYGYKLSDFALQDSSAEKRSKREDYRLVWQAKPHDPRNVGDAHYRLEAGIAGDEVVSFARSFKLPEAWVRRQESSSLATDIPAAAGLALGALLLVGAVWLFVLQVRRGALRWIPALEAACVLAVLLALMELNAIPELAAAYDTSISFANFKLQAGVSYLAIVLLAGVILWLLVALATSLYPEAWQVLRSGPRRVWRRDAAIATVVALLAAVAVSKLMTLLANHFHAFARLTYGGLPTLWGTEWPAGGAIVQGLLAAVVAPVLLALAIYGVRLGWQRRAWWFWLGLAVLLIGLGPSGAHSVPEFALDWAARFVPLLAAVLILIFFFGNNALAYVTACFCSAVVRPMLDLLSNPARYYRANGIVLAIAAALALVWLLAPGRGTRPLPEGMGHS